MDSIEPCIADTRENAQSLTWAHCIPTVNRIDILKVAVACSIAQTRPPREIIVVSASENWERDRDELRQIVKGHDINLIVVAADVRSSAVQRNQALKHVTSDIVLFTDDDSLVFPDFADEMMKIYERDQERKIAGVGGHNVSELPPVAKAVMEGVVACLKEDPLSNALEKKNAGNRGSAIAVAFFENNGATWRWFRRNVLMMSMETMFVPYDKKRSSITIRLDQVRDVVGHDSNVSDYMPGYAMSVRTQIARDEPFNPFLLAYCPLEDLDATYRFGRHGCCVISRKSRLNHYEVAASRVTRKLATSLGISNMALFIYTNSNDLRWHKVKFGIYVLRRLIGETIKDVGSKRFDLPQARGVLGAIPVSIGIFRRPFAKANLWYVDRQREMLASTRR